MIKVKVIKEFHLGKFDELKNIIRASSKNAKGYLYVGDTFECVEEMYEYLTKGNGKGTFVEIMEIIPEEKAEETVNQEEVKPKRTRKKKVEE